MTEKIQTTAMTPEKSEIIIYQTDDGKTRIDVRMDNETVWLTQAQMAELFQTTKQNISLHINNLFEKNELERSSVVKEYLTVQNEGNRQACGIGAARFANETLLTPHNSSKTFSKLCAP